MLMQRLLFIVADGRRLSCAGIPNDIDLESGKELYQNRNQYSDSVKFRRNGGYFSDKTKKSTCQIKCENMFNRYKYGH